jgi:hypothetical protein
MDCDTAVMDDTVETLVRAGVSRSQANAIVRSAAGRLCRSAVGGGMGQSDATMARITAVQNSLSTRAAEVNAADQSAWDMIFANAQAQSDPSFLTWNDARNLIINTMRTVIVTASHTPSDDDIASAENASNAVSAMTSRYTSANPDAAATISAAATDMRNRLAKMTPLKSPETAGKEAFLQSLEDQTKKLGSAFSIGTGVAIAAAAVVGGIALLNYLK